MFINHRIFNGIERDGALKLHPGTLLDPLGVVMLYLLDLAYRISESDNLLGGLPSREDEVHRRRFIGHHGDDVLQIDQLEVQGDIDLVKDYQVMLPGGNHLPGHLQSRLGKFPVDGRRVIPHDETVQTAGADGEVGETTLGGQDFAILFALHELDHKNLTPMTQGAEGLTDGGRRLSLAVAGNDHDDSPVELRQGSFYNIVRRHFFAPFLIG